MTGGRRGAHLGAGFAIHPGVTSATNANDTSNCKQHLES